jgi:hypothetical protein
MSEFSGGNAGNEVFRNYSPGPPSGVGTDPNARFAPGAVEGRAWTAFTLGIFSLVLGVLTGVPAIWVGRNALMRIADADGEVQGRWQAWVGIALGVLGIALTIAAWVYLHQHPGTHHPHHATRVQ